MLQTFSTICLLWSTVAHAQLDSTSTVLLRASPKQQQRPKQTDLDSTRYRVRQPESRKDDDDLEERPGTVIPSPVAPKSKKVSAQATPGPQPSPEPTQFPPVAPLTPPPLIASPPGQSASQPVTEQVKELIMGGSAEDIDDFKKKIHPEDPRANVLTINAGPAYFYNGSQSNYSLRRYNSNGIGIGLGMNVWITPFFGLQSKYFSSVSASQKSGGVNFAPVEVQTFEAGIRFRKYFGVSRKAPHLSWGIDYHDSLNKISRESQVAIGRKSSGMSLSLEGEIPEGNAYSHLFQIDVRPRLRHSEMNSGLDARSGGKNETNAVGAGFGGAWTMDRRNQVYWKSQYIFEQNHFSGEASLLDPHNDTVPSGVTVSNSILILYFGFKWGS